MPYIKDDVFSLDILQLNYNYSLVTIALVFFCHVDSGGLLIIFNISKVCLSVPEELIYVSFRSI